MRNWQKPALPHTSLRRCRRSSPSCSSRHVLKAKTAFGGDDGARRWQAAAWIYLWLQKPATLSRKRRGNPNILYHGPRRLGRAQNPSVRQPRPNPFAAVRSGFDPSDLGFPYMAFASHHRKLQTAVHACGELQNSKPSFHLCKNLHYNSINRTEETWTYSKRYIRDTHRRK